MEVSTIVFVALIGLGGGWLLGLTTRRYLWPTCPGTTDSGCGRHLRCPRCDAETLRQELASAGPVARDVAW